MQVGMGGADDVVAALMRDRWRALVGYGYLLSGSLGEAEDLAQEALVRVVIRSRDGGDVRAVEAYVRRTMASLVVDGARRGARWRRVRHLLAADAGPAHAEPAPERLAAEHDALRRALAELPRRERACVVLRHLEDLTVDDTAAVLGLSAGAVKRYTSDGLARLSAHLGPLVGADPETTEVGRSPR